MLKLGGDLSRILGANEDRTIPAALRPNTSDVDYLRAKSFTATSLQMRCIDRRITAAGYSLAGGKRTPNDNHRRGKGNGSSGVGGGGGGGGWGDADWSGDEEWYANGGGSQQQLLQQHRRSRGRGLSKQDTMVVRGVLRRVIDQVVKDHRYVCTRGPC